MMGKALLNLDEVARILDPTFEPNPTIEAHAAELMRKKMLQSASPGNLMAAAIDAKEFAEKLPGRINKVMDALAEGQLTLNVQGIDDKELMRGVQKLANRLTTGMVVAALVIGAALIMRIDVRAQTVRLPGDRHRPLRPGRGRRGLAARQHRDLRPAPTSPPRADRITPAPRDLTDGTRR